MTKKLNYVFPLSCTYFEKSISNYLIANVRGVFTENFHLFTANLSTIMLKIIIFIYYPCFCTVFIYIYIKYIVLEHSKC